MFYFEEFLKLLKQLNEETHVTESSEDDFLFEKETYLSEKDLQEMGVVSLNLSCQPAFRCLRCAANFFLFLAS